MISTVRGTRVSSFADSTAFVIDRDLTSVSFGGGRCHRGSVGPTGLGVLEGGVGALDCWRNAVAVVNTNNPSRIVMVAMSLPKRRVNRRCIPTPPVLLDDLT